MNFAHSEVATLDPNTMRTLCEEYVANNYIDPETSERLGVKRGLRNPDGTGVLAGLTNVCDVVGYKKDQEGHVIPTPGKLIYRGVNINEIVDEAYRNDRFVFEEVIWLLLFGSLPNREQLDDFCEILAEHRALPEGFMDTMNAPSPNIMNKLQRCVLGLYSYDEHAEDLSLENILSQSINLIASMPTMMVNAYQMKRRYYDKQSMFFHLPKPGQSTAEHILSTYRPDQKFTHEEAKLLDMCLLVHADHGGGNCSTFTTRVLSSSGTDTYSAIAAAIGALKGPNGIADIFCGDRFARKAHLFQQRFQTRTVRVLQLAQARLDKGAVFAGKRHHVRHSTHSGKVAAVVQHFFRRAAIQCGTQLERHACTAQALEGTGVVLTTGVYHGNGLGQSFRRQMMVGNDQVNAQFSGIIGFFHSRNAVIHRHDQLAALIVDGTDGIARKAVAVALAAGQHTFYGSPHALEMLVQQGRGRHAVHVIIAEHHNGLALVNGPPDALAGLVHIGEQRRVAQLFLTGKQGQCFGRVGNAACRQHARQQGIFLLLGGKGGRIFLLAPRLVVLCVIFQFFGGLLRNRLRQLPQRGTVQRFQIPCTVCHSKFPPVRPSLASIPCRAAISEETSIATSESSVSYRVS